MKGRKKQMGWNAKCMLCLLPSLAGTAVFYVMPYLRVLYYSMISDQFSRRFVGFDHYIEVLGNTYFRLALINSLLMILFCVPTLILLALGISLMLSFGSRGITRMKTAFVLPMVIPTACIALIWRNLFSGIESVMPLYLLFIWKNTGICVILLTAAFSTIDKSIFEAAWIEGASGIKLHCSITIPMILPAIFFSVLLTIVNSFKVFKEAYLYYGTNYPPDYSYTLQYYMNNNFLKLDYQKLSVAAVLTSFVVLWIVVGGLRVQRRFRQ